ncbi:MAG: hypothetical protein JSS83_20665 [Cyanobacteria bacterium SZAS LIN-3]|nr:hypothetical protein [Cyanobacteria bacterium SZAS LIN-3]
MTESQVDLNRAKPGKMDSISLWSAITGISVLLILLRDLLLNKSEISSWLAMRICGVGLMMQDCKPYIDFWDWTLPTVYDFLKMPCALRLGLEKCGLYLPLNLFIIVFVWVLVLVSVLVTTLIVKRALASQANVQIGAELGQETQSELKLLAIPFVASISLGSLVVRFDMGDLQHLLALAIWPYLLLRWLTCRGLSAGPWLGLIVGAVAGITACFDVPFALVFAALEVYFVLQQRSLKILARPEVLGFLIAAAVCLVRMTQLEEPSSTAFWKWTMGLRMLNYEVWNEALFAALASPDRRDVCYVMALTLALAFIFKKRSTVVFPLIIVMLAGFGIFMLEGEGFSHDLILSIMACCSILSILALSICTDFVQRFISEKERLSFARWRYPLVLSAALVVALGFAVSLEKDRDRLKDFQASQAKGGMSDTMTTINKYSAWKDRVLVLADIPGPAYPALLVLDRSPGGYMLWSRPLRLFEWIKKNRTLDGPMRDFYKYTYSKLRSDLTSPDLKLVLIHNYYAREIMDKENIMPMFDRGYILVPDCINYSAGNWQPREFVGLNWAFNVFQRPD